MARTYKRDSRGRFAGGGGGSSGGKRGGTGKGGSGGRKRNKSFVTTTGTFLTRGRAKVAQTARTKAFSSKATAGRSAKDAYKAASGAARKGAKAPRKPLRAPKTPAQMQAQADRILDSLKGQRLSSPGGRRSYAIQDRINRVNASVKQVLPKYRHNPLRKGSSIASATRAARQRTNNARYNASLDNWNRGMPRR